MFFTQTVVPMDLAAAVVPFRLPLLSNSSFTPADWSAWRVTTYTSAKAQSELRASPRNPKEFSSCTSVLHVSGNIHHLLLWIPSEINRRPKSAMVDDLQEMSVILQDGSARNNMLQAEDFTFFGIVSEEYQACLCACPDICPRTISNKHDCSQDQYKLSQRSNRLDAEDLQAAFLSS